MDWTLHTDDQNQTFKDKQKDLFAELDKVKTALPQERYVNRKEKTDRAINRRSTMKTYKGKNSIFKRPEAPLRKCLPPRRKPDYQVNPQKWTKYSLNDVTDEDMSEKSNKNAALSFLKELEKRKADEQERKDRICFQNSAVVTAKQEEEAQEAVFANSKRIMPEYVIGQKIKKEKKNLEKRGVAKNKELPLSHLTQYQEEEEENST